MSEQVTRAPSLAAETPRPRDASVVVPLSDKLPPPVQQAKTEEVVAAPPAPILPDRRRGGRWLLALCAVLALAAAAVSLAAPALRPQIAHTADAMLGPNNAVARLLVPDVVTPVREAVMRAVSAQLADYTARLERLAAAQQAMNADMTRAIADFRADHAANEALARAVDGLTQQTKDLSTLTTAIDARARAAGLLTLAMRLRRDLDGGLPIDRDLAAVVAAGPYPPAIATALQELHRVRDGAPTMHDLADDLDRLTARLAARAAADTSWPARSWTRVTTLLGGGAASPDARLIERLHSLGADGRFSEAANEIMASDMADQGMAWAARVRERATAVLATQSLLAYSLAAYENAFAPTGVQ